MWTLKSYNQSCPLFALSKTTGFEDHAHCPIVHFPTVNAFTSHCLSTAILGVPSIPILSGIFSRTHSFLSHSISMNEIAWRVGSMCYSHFPYFFFFFFAIRILWGTPQGTWGHVPMWLPGKTVHTSFFFFFFLQLPATIGARRWTFSMEPLG